MATKPRKTSRKAPARPLRGLFRRIMRGVGLAVLACVGLSVAMTLLFGVVNPPVTPYVQAEKRRLGDVSQQWVSIDEMAPVLLRSVVAAEDANFCLHWGLDVAAIRDAIDSGAERGGSTISQQVVKNVFLWQGRSWLRKALEALWTPLVEALWSKRRILELYLNVAEFDEGVFGAQAAARHYFGVDARDLTPRQAARLAVVLPSPKTRSARDLSPALQRRAASVQDGAATIERDGRATCFAP